MNVVCVDKDAEKIASLQRGEIPIYEPGLEEVVARNERAGRLRFTTDLKAADRELARDLHRGRHPAASPTARRTSRSSARSRKSIAGHMNGYKVVVTKSTVPTGTGQDDRADPAREERRATSSPSSRTPSSCAKGRRSPTSCVRTASSSAPGTRRAVEVMQGDLRPLYLIETPFLVTDVESAEMIKYASNGFLAVKISFINEVARLCELMGADVHDVAKGMGLDKRIGPKFLHPGPGFGGSCFPKDTPRSPTSRDSTATDSRSSKRRFASTQSTKGRMIEKIETAADGPLARQDGRGARALVQAGDRRHPRVAGAGGRRGPAAARRGGARLRPGRGGERPESPGRASSTRRTPTIAPAAPTRSCS